MTLKSTHLPNAHHPYGSLSTSFFRPVCPDAACRWVDLLISDDKIIVERDGDLMRLTAHCDLPIMRYYASGEPRKHAKIISDPNVHDEFDFISEFSRLLSHDSLADIWTRSPDGQLSQYTVTPAKLN